MNIRTAAKRRQRTMQRWRDQADWPWLDYKRIHDAWFRRRWAMAAASFRTMAALGLQLKLDVQAVADGWQKALAALDVAIAAVKAGTPAARPTPSAPTNPQP